MLNCKNPSSFATEIFFTSLSTPVLFLPIPAGQAEGILEMMGVRYISSLDKFHNQVTLVPAIYSESAWFFYSSPGMLSDTCTITDSYICLSTMIFSTQEFSPLSLKLLFRNFSARSSEPQSYFSYMSPRQDLFSHYSTSLCQIRRRRSKKLLELEKFRQFQVKFESSDES